MQTILNGLMGRGRMRDERGQTLPLFAIGLIGLIGLVALSVDVGRLLWARTQMQAAVDAAALAAAQDMPHGTSAASAAANTYWSKNASFITSQGQNVSFTTNFPAGNKAVNITGQADIPTFFARVFGINAWHVSATGTAASQVLDIAIVLDISGSMCMASYPETETANSIYLMSPGRLTVPAGGFSFPRLAADISATTGNSITITLNDVRVFTSTNAATNRSNFGDGWNSTTPYWQRTPSGGGSPRAGMIQIDDELFKITAVNAAANQLTVTRAQWNNASNTPTLKAFHHGSANAADTARAYIWALHGTDTLPNPDQPYCDKAAPYQATTTTNGPHEPFDSMISNAKYFTNFFNESYDKIGLASFSSSGTINYNLISTFSTVRTQMDAILVPQGGTNIAYAAALGRRIATGSGSRMNSKKIVVLLTDGMTNTVCQNSSYSPANYDGSCSSPQSPGTSTAYAHLTSEANRLKTAGVTLYTIGLGTAVDDTNLQAVAELTGGKYFKSPTTAELDDAFANIAAETHIQLTQ